MGIYDQLENLNQAPPSSTALTGVPASHKSAAAPQTKPASQPTNEGDLPESSPSAQQSASLPTHQSDHLRDEPRDNPREKSRELPTRDEIQEFSFRLRDELKVKVQAEVPADWQDELEQIARDLDIKKLELYRFILGRFLGKVLQK